MILIISGSAYRIRFIAESFASDCPVFFMRRNPDTCTNRNRFFGQSPIELIVMGPIRPEGCSGEFAL
jgi:hypothetical protein